LPFLYPLFNRYIDDLKTAGSAGRVHVDFIIDSFPDQCPADGGCHGYFVLIDVRFEGSDQLIFYFFSPVAVGDGDKAPENNFVTLDAFQNDDVAGSQVVFQLLKFAVQIGLPFFSRCVFRVSERSPCARATSISRIFSGMETFLIVSKSFF